jgi:Radical SAM superfamily
MAVLHAAGRVYNFPGEWVEGTAWQRFGLYNSYVVIRGDGAVRQIAAHAGELVPGSTEDLVDALRTFDLSSGVPPVPLTLELDTTYQCASRNCGSSCFSAPYRATNPNASIARPVLTEIIQSFAAAGGRILRFDGGGDPLLHPDVRSGELVELASRSGLKTTILTSGDLLKRTALDRIAESGCYVRVSLNAATEKTRRLFHGNEIPLAGIAAAIEQLSALLQRIHSDVPIGATFLAGRENYREVLDCALLARRIGVGHFSVRRVLGPAALRPGFTDAEEREFVELIGGVKGLHSSSFRVSVPWRSVTEADLNPSAGDFSASRCWQSTFKAVLEPSASGARGQLCGRYRGGGVGQLMKMPDLISVINAADWVNQWRASFAHYPVTRSQLPRTCVSCIDRGFIRMTEQLLAFVGQALSDFRILHLNNPEMLTTEHASATV